MFSIACLLLICSHFSFANIPQNFRVELFRDVTSQLRVRGIFNWENQPATRVVTPWIQSHGCGLVNQFGEHSLSLEGHDGARANVDVTDMVPTTMSFQPPMGFCISFNAALTRSIESILYINSDENESLIFRPRDVDRFSLFNQIAYTNIDHRGSGYGRTLASQTVNGLIVGESNEVDRLVFAINGHGPSTVHQVTFATIVASIESTGARIRESNDGLEVHGLSNCYEQLLTRLPRLHYLLSDHQDPNAPATTRLVFHPEDYLVARESDDTVDVCDVNIGTDQPGTPLILSEHFIRRLGGVHFDYANRRIGFFDPL